MEILLLYWAVKCAFFIRNYYCLNNIAEEFHCKPGHRKICCGDFYASRKDMAQPVAENRENIEAEYDQDGVTWQDGYKCAVDPENMQRQDKQNP